MSGENKLSIFDALVALLMIKSPWSTGVKKKSGLNELVSLPMHDGFGPGCCMDSKTL